MRRLSNHCGNRGLLGGLRWGLALMLAGGLLASSGGCTRVLFSPREPRTQYDRYDEVRNQLAPAYIEDEFGRRTPNLRGRLAPRN